jgi:hypothetical protein
VHGLSHVFPYTQANSLPDFSILDRPKGQDEAAVIFNGYEGLGSEFFRACAPALTVIVTKHDKSVIWIPCCFEYFFME